MGGCDGQESASVPSGRTRDQLVAEAPASFRHHMIIAAARRALRDLSQDQYRLSLNVTCFPAD